jgi:hypothetical protein
MNRSRVALLLGCVSLAGCELVAGIQELSLMDGGGATSEGGSDSPAGDSPGDDSPAEHESSTADSPSDAPGNPQRDSGLDGGEGGNSCGTPGGFFCASLSGGMLTLDTASFVSSPNSLLAQDNALSSGTLDTALRSVFPVATTATITFDFQFQPVAVDPSTSAVLVAASLDFTDAAMNRYTLQFTLVQEGTSLNMRFEEQAGGVDGSMFYASHDLPDPSGPRRR